MKNYYVYIYFDPRSTPPEAIYVGKGHGNRFKDHIKGAKNKHFFNKLNKIKKSNLEPIIEFFKTDITNEEALIIEIDLISKYGRIDKKTGSLCNHTDGGEGTSGRTCSKNTKKLMSEQRKGKNQTSAQYKANCTRKVSLETKQKISIANKGKKLNIQHIEKIRLANTGKIRLENTKKLMSEQRKGKKQTPAQYKANCSRKVKTKEIKCLNNNVIYNSAKQAALNLNLTTNAIHAVANGNRNHHKGYKFVFI